MDVDLGTRSSLEPHIAAWLLPKVELELAQELLDLNMGLSDAKRGFRERVKGKVKLDDARLVYVNDRQTLRLCGQYDDGTPYEFVTAPFDGCPIEKARKIATDLNMPAPAQIKGLANTLREQLQSAVRRAAQAGEDAKSEVANLHSTIDQVDETVKDIKSATADIQSALGLSTNGGPPLSGES